MKVVKITAMRVVEHKDLMKKYPDKEILIHIQKAIDSSPELRSKKALIETFIAGINDVDDVMEEWHGFVADERERELVTIIKEENLKEEETRKFIDNAFRDSRLTLIRNNFRFIHNFILDEGYADGIDGILADLGVSSHQFDTPERGFSFRFDATLDMRMNTNAAKTAADIVNSYSEEDLERLLRVYGEVEGSRKAASLIVRARSGRSILTTGALQEVLSPVLPQRMEHKALAKIFQALRIEVNGEMRDLEKFLYGATQALKPGGRLVIITYHSLEDRMVKNFIKAGNVEGRVEQDFYGNRLTPLRAVNNKVIVSGRPFMTIHENTLPNQKRITNASSLRSLPNHPRRRQIRKSTSEAISANATVTRDDTK